MNVYLLYYCIRNASPRHLHSQGRNLIQIRPLYCLAQSHCHLQGLHQAFLCLATGVFLL